MFKIDVEGEEESTRYRSHEAAIEASKMLATKYPSSDVRVQWDDSAERAEFAKVAMAGFIAAGEFKGAYQKLAIAAVEQADALITALHP
jgi:hypothetical protein